MPKRNFSSFHLLSALWVTRRVWPGSRGPSILRRTFLVSFSLSLLEWVQYRAFSTTHQQVQEGAKETHPTELGSAYHLRSVLGDDGRCVYVCRYLAAVFLVLRCL